MNKLVKKSLRDIRQSKGQFIAITLIIAVGAFFFTGATMLSDSLSSYTEEYYDDYNLNDIIAYYSQISDEDIAVYDEIEGINKIEGRYTFEATHTEDGIVTDLTVHTIPVNNTINIPMITDGILPSNKDDIILDSHYAKEHGFQVGDSLFINTENQEIGFRISGFCENVEHAYNIKDPSMVIPDHKLYGVAYISQEKLADITGNAFYNEIIIDVTKGYDNDEIGNMIEEKSQGLPYLYHLTKERMVSYTQLSNNIIMNKMMSLALPTLLFFVAAVILFLAMSRMVDSERSQIGIMKSLGIKNRRIILHYVLYSVLAGVLGSIVGFGLGYPLFQVMGIVQMEQLYSLPEFALSMEFINILPIAFCAIIFGIIASYLSCRRILKESAAAAMRPKPPKKCRKILLERLTVIWRNISYGKKIIFRNIFMTKKRAICTAVGVVLCVILLIVSFGYSSSLDVVGDTLLNDVYQYDLRVDYKGPVNSETLDLPSDIKDYHSLEEIPVQLNTSEQKKDTILTVLENENTLIKLYDEKRNTLSLDDTGVVISKSYADEYGLSVGDSLSLKFISPEYQGKTINAKISKISLQYSGQAIYCTPLYLESFGLDYQPYSLVVKMNDSKNISNAYDYFMKDEYVNKITLKEDLEKSINSSLEQSYPIVILFALCAILLSSAAIFTISSINIFERNRDIATLKVLGYQKSKINRLIFTENIIVTTFSIIIALPVGILIYKNFTKILSTVDQIVPDNLKYDTLLLSVIITYIVTIISNLLLRKKVRKIDMIESLKSVE